MKRSDLEHILRASKGVTAETEFIVIGSQAILGAFPDAPRVLRQSMEADVYPKYRPELSPFHQTFGYFADGVSPNPATLPTGWEERLVRLANDNTGGAVGWCLEPHDLAFSKLAAGREKDIAFVSALLRFKMVRASRLHEIIKAVDDTDLQRRVTEGLAVCERAKQQ
jgi:hypothetical protein